MTLIFTLMKIAVLLYLPPKIFEFHGLSILLLNNCLQLLFLLIFLVPSLIRLFELRLDKQNVLIFLIDSFAHDFLFVLVINYSLLVLAQPVQ